MTGRASADAAIPLDDALVAARLACGELVSVRDLGPAPVRLDVVEQIRERIGSERPRRRKGAR
jgi:hypothetical protein